jgi:3-oxoacyl-[acyl-carrier protein] reductase
MLTGASGGIGIAISEKLRQSGYEVLAPTSQELNLNCQNSVSNWLDKHAEISLQGLILAAGVNYPENLFGTETDRFEEIQQINFLANRKLLSVFVPRMVEQNFGRIVSISSAYSNLARSGRASYSISKAGLDALMRSIALEFGRNNVLANSVVPGFVDTPLTRKNNSQSQIEHILTRIPIGRLGTPDEIAKATMFLLSSENTYVTGQRIYVDGGFSIN